MDRFRDELHEQAEAIREATGRRRVLNETVTDKRGRTCERRRRPLANTSINAMITLLGQIMQQAVDYRHRSQPCPGRWSLRAVPEALPAGGRWVATPGLAGLRISEMVDLRVAQVDLQGGRLELSYANPDAAVREVEISLYELLEHVRIGKPATVRCARRTTSSARQPAAATPTASGSRR